MRILVGAATDGVAVAGTGAHIVGHCRRGRGRVWGNTVGLVVCQRLGRCTILAKLVDLVSRKDLDA
jgi:hypothetical protein